MTVEMSSWPIPLQIVLRISAVIQHEIIINDQNYPEEPYARAEETFPPDVIAQINSVSNIPHLLDVASVTDDSAIGKRVVHFKLKNTRQWQKLPITHEHIEGLVSILRGATAVN
jgi:hypothetical protein